MIYLTLWRINAREVGPCSSPWTGEKKGHPHSLPFHPRGPHLLGSTAQLVAAPPWVGGSKDKMSWDSGASRGAANDFNWLFVLITHCGLRACSTNLHLTFIFTYLERAWPPQSQAWPCFNSLICCWLQSLILFVLRSPWTGISYNSQCWLQLDQALRSSDFQSLHRLVWRMHALKAWKFVTTFWATL